MFDDLSLAKVLTTWIMQIEENDSHNPRVLYLWRTFLKAIVVFDLKKRIFTALV